MSLPLEAPLPREPTIEEVRDFVRAAKAAHPEEIVAASVGRLNRRLCIWLYIPDVDVELTGDLFDLQLSREDAQFAPFFELHVSSLQGRAVESSMLPGFQLLDI